MTTALAGLLLGVVGAALLLAVAAYLWLNRAPSVEQRFDEYGRVPLFGVDLTNVPRPIPRGDSVETEYEDDEDDAADAPPRHSRAADVTYAPPPQADALALDASGVGSSSSETNNASFAPPPAVTGRAIDELSPEASRPAEPQSS